MGDGKTEENAIDYLNAGGKFLLKECVAFEYIWESGKEPSEHTQLE